MGVRGIVHTMSSSKNKVKEINAHDKGSRSIRFWGENFWGRNKTLKYHDQVTHSSFVTRCTGANTRVIRATIA